MEEIPQDKLAAVVVAAVAAYEEAEAAELEAEEGRKA